MQAQAALQANDYLRQILNVLSGRAVDTPVNPHIPIDSRSIGAGPGGRAQPASDT